MTAQIGQQKAWLRLAKRPGATINQILKASEIMAKSELKRPQEKKQRVQTDAPVRAFQRPQGPPGHYWVLEAFESCRACISEPGMICVVGSDWCPGQLCAPCELRKAPCTLSRRTQGGTKSRPHLAGDLHQQACDWVASWNLVDQVPVRDKGKGRAVKSGAQVPADAPAMVPVRQVKDLEVQLASMESDLEALNYQNLDLKHRLHAFEQGQGVRPMEGIVETGPVKGMVTGIGPFASVQMFVDRLRQERHALQEERAEMAVLMDQISKLL